MTALRGGLHVVRAVKHGAHAAKMLQRVPFAGGLTEAIPMLRLAMMSVENPEMAAVTIPLMLWLAFGPQIMGLNAGPFATAEQQRQFFLKRIYGAEQGMLIYHAEFNRRQQETDLRGKVP